MNTMLLVLWMVLITGLTGCANTVELSTRHDPSVVNHVVLLWFKADLPAQQLVKIKSGTKALAEIPGIIKLSYGKAITGKRRFVDSSFDLGVYMQFRSVAEMRAYQQHPQHVTFFQQQIKPWLKKIKVYDFQT